jgi:hypothetical protein
VKSRKCGLPYAGRVDNSSRADILSASTRQSTLRSRQRAWPKRSRILWSRLSKFRRRPATKVEDFVGASMPRGFCLFPEAYSQRTTRTSRRSCLSLQGCFRIPDSAKLSPASSMATLWPARRSALVRLQLRLACDLLRCVSRFSSASYANASSPRIAGAVESREPGMRRTRPRRFDAMLLLSLICAD